MEKGKRHNVILTIVREYLKPSAQGQITIDGKPFGRTLERAWLDNLPMVSCIPAGEYSMGWTHSPRFKRKMLEVLRVPGRAGIRIHSADYVGELQGCIAIATDHPGGFAAGKSLVPELETLVQKAILSGVAVKLIISNPEVIA